ncbi:nickel-binding protein [Enhygromyxa salina]|nr:nickel-binding protein [Enhygromyxa salina]
MTVHRAPGLLKEQWAENAPSVHAAQHARFVQAYVNLGAGFIFTIYEADTQDKLIEQFEELGLPYDEIHEIQFSQSAAELEQMLRKMGKLSGAGKAD